MTRPFEIADDRFLVSRVARQGVIVHLQDVLANAVRPSQQQDVHRRFNVGTGLGVPMVNRGQVIGVFGLWRRQVEPFTDVQIQLVQTFADQAVIAIENARLVAELRESLEQQTATAEILGVISQSPTAIQPVLDAIVAHAARLCETENITLSLAQGGELFRVAEHALIGVPPRSRVPIRREASVVARAFLDREVIAVDDMTALPEDEFPGTAERARQRGQRSNVWVPMVHNGTSVGVIIVGRAEVRPFTNRQIELLRMFADQAVIAIENVRLFTELQQRTTDLQEALEQQTATSEVLQTISRSAFDLDNVLRSLTECAVKLTGARMGAMTRFEGDHYRHATAYGFSKAALNLVEATPLRPLDNASLTGRVGMSNDVVQVSDTQADPDFSEAIQEFNEVLGIRTALGVPLLRGGTPIGTIMLFKTVVEPFARRQIELVTTFADQAVIAIENARLVSELQESLEQQTATAEILSVISRSPTDVQPVLDTIVDHANRVCSGDGTIVSLVEGEKYRLAAGGGSLEETFRKEYAEPQLLRPTSLVGRAMTDGQLLRVDDAAALDPYEFPDAARRNRVSGARSMIHVPLRRGDQTLGAITVACKEVRPFSDRETAILEIFADQAVIAIENVRLFTELQQRTQELARSVERLQALGEVGLAVSSTLDIQQVLSTILNHAVQLTSADSGTIYEFENQTGRLVRQAVNGITEEDAQALQDLGGLDPSPARLTLVGQAALSREPVQTPDMVDPNAESVEIAGIREAYARLGMRAALAVPLLLEGNVLGVIVLRRKTPGEFSPDTVELLQTLASQSAIAIQNARLYAELERKSLELEVASQHKSQFLANMSHELRTPLNAIIGFSEMLSKQMLGELTDEQNDVIEDVLNAGKHLFALINDILDLSKVEAGRMELEISTFFLRATLDMGLTMIKERAASHGIQLDLVVGEAVNEVNADERKIKQVIVNLLSNAVKFTPDGGRIRVAARQLSGLASQPPVHGNTASRDVRPEMLGLGPTIVISISDTGVGIAPEDQPKVFEEFEQVGTAEAVKREGTGLGLPLAKKFVELHGGHMWLESEPGKGSTFTFTLPVRQPEQVRPREVMGGAR